MFGDVFLKLNLIKEKVVSLVADLVEGAELEEAREEYKTLLMEEELYFKLKSRAHWLKEGDRNTKFFQQSIKNRHKKASVSYIVKEGG